MSKTPPNITLTQFNLAAQPMTFVAGATSGSPLTVVGVPKEFSTGSFGWYGSGKAIALVDGKPVQVQLAVTATIIGSKDAPR